MNSWLFRLKLPRIQSKLTPGQYLPVWYIAPPLRNKKR